MEDFDRADLIDSLYEDDAFPIYEDDLSEEDFDDEDYDDDYEQQELEDFEQVDEYFGSYEE